MAQTCQTRIGQQWMCCWRAAQARKRALAKTCRYGTLPIPQVHFAASIPLNLVCRMVPPRTADVFNNVQIWASLPCHLSHVCVLILEQVLQGPDDWQSLALGDSSIHQQRLATGFVFLDNMLVLALGPVSPANATALRLARVSWA